MLLAGYDVRKAAQAAAFFALKSGGSINVLKLSKLMYLSEREFMARFDEPMFYDRLFSMPDGPVASVTLNLMNGNAEDQTWSEFLAPRDGYAIPLNGDVEFDALDTLSRADLSVLESLWDKFKDFDKYAIRDWTHGRANVPEWRDPNGSSMPIHHEEVFRYLGRDDCVELAEEVQSHRRMHEFILAAER
ncbi:Panacea domain-containing protein [Notoacmeibacter sp. MSK16QG-6]|uniref:Panacea domain-containing protein n=1 Tax=Notoacmeibacter sp. MSK16QG-6 TaxID=2957982 RepID=UPI0020A0FDC6|nr:Panacea domain-containing protein [Notoacmeibacter sp. MSK16QG-6]MCP1198698.1 Panacea domain-containing protein [Notoacmeibacter sp. MSK16QG-6]